MTCPANSTRWCALGLLLIFVMQVRLQGEIVLQGSGEITGFELYADGGFWWRGFGVCGGEFPRQAAITIANADFRFAQPTTLATGCNLLQHDFNNVVRDDSWVYFFADARLWRKFVGDPNPGYGEWFPAPPTFPILWSDESGARLELADQTLFWGSYSVGMDRITIRGLATDGSDATAYGTIENAGAPVAKLQWFQYREASGRVTVTRDALAVLLGNGRLFRFDLESGKAESLAAGIRDFALHRVHAFLSNEFTAYIYAAESEAGVNPSPAATPGKLWRITTSNPAEKILVYEAPAATRRQILSVAVDPGGSNAFASKKIYLADAPVDCSGLFCVLGNISIRRATLPTPDADPGAWDVIVNDNGGFNLRSDGDWLYYLDHNTVSRIKTDAPPVEFDLELLNLEVTQGLQNMGHSIDLIAGREGTIGRGYAYIAKNNTDAEDVFPDAVLHVTFSDEGTPIPGSPFYAVNNARLNGSSVFGALRSDTTRSFLFDVGKLPHGLLRFEMTVNPNENPAETGSDPYANNTGVRVLEVRDAGEACVVAIPMPTPTGTYDVWEKDFPQMIRRAESLLPVKRLNVRCWQVLTDGGHVGNIVQDRFFEDVTAEKDDGQDGDALDAVECVESASSHPGGCLQAKWVGLIHPGISGFNGLGNRPGSSSIVRMAPDSFTDPWNTPLGGRTMAHELGHNFGRKHVDCGDPKNPDENYPYNDCWFGPGGETSYWGFDPISRTPIQPSFAGDLLSYRDTRWTSPYTWNAIWVDGFFGGFPAGLEPVHVASETSSVLMVNGALFLDLGSARLSAFFQVEPGIFDPEKVEEAFAESLAASGEADRFVVRLVDAAGTTLQESALPTSVQEDGTEGRIGFSHFTPWNPATRRVQLVRNDSIWAERFVSPNAPTISIDAVGLDPAEEEIHVEWSAFDADADPLVFIVQYTPDDGAHWETYRFNYPATGLTMSTRRFPGGEQARIRILASDGVLTAAATSEVFYIPDHPPMPLISGVGEGERLPFGKTIDLYALVIDPEDGRLAQPATWILAGPSPASHAGDLFRLHDLAPGSYTATATGIDTTDQEGATTRHFEVLAMTVGEADAPSVDGLCNDSGYAGATFFRLTDSSGRRIPVRVLHSGSAMFISFTGLARGSGRAGGAARVGLRIDIDGEGETIEEGDRGLFIDENGIPTVESPSGNQWLTGDSPAGGFQAASHLTENGWCAEMMIPDHLLGGWNHGVRLVFMVGSAAWPNAAAPDQPASWAKTWLGTELLATGANRPPAADAGPDQVVNVAASRRIVLNGANSSDPDGDALAFSWTQTAGPEVTLVAADTPNPSFELATPTDPSTLQFRLVVNDGEFESNPAFTAVRAYPISRLVALPHPGGTLTPNGFQGRLIDAAPGSPYQIQGSTNLESWSPVQQNAADFQGTIQFLDTEFDQYPHRFYRAVPADTP